MAQKWRKIGANEILGGFLNLLSFGSLTFKVESGES
jgi:hypothetical protein